VIAVLALVVTLVSDGAATPKHVPLRLVVTNTGRKPERFCDYHTPFEGVRNAFMEVVGQDGKRVDYAGMMAKRAAPTAEDYRTVAPGKTDEATFDLTQGYALSPGRYTVKFTGGSISGLPDSSVITVDVR
jgi:hypothetical protein